MMLIKGEDASGWGRILPLIIKLACIQAAICVLYLELVAALMLGRCPMHNNHA